MTKPVDITRSRQFVRSAVLPPAPARKRGEGAGDGDDDAVDEALQAGKAQAAVVGSEQVSFATHVAPQWRQYLINCSLALVKTTLDALSSMDQNSPFITLFSRVSQQAQAARFQISLAEQSANGGLTVALMAFGLEAKTTLTQVLYFKSLASQATLRHCTGKVSTNPPLLEALRPDLSEPLKEHSRSFIRKPPSKLLKPAG